ncbi:MAG: polysaccharide deacetylase family protein [Candidatus Omnitrophica bacterium]|nr:polysaccharide deacetylase family protein [Candidatus Omnitrophota bacterium]
MKKLRFGIFSIILFSAFLVFLWLPSKYVVPVMMYHSIDIAKTDFARANTVSPENFARQMRFLKEHDYKVLTPDEYVEITRSGREFPSKSVLITFDDGLLDNYTAAYPILKQYGFSAVMFIPVADVGTAPGRWDVPQMSWEQLKEMAAHGIAIGSHTITHAYLPDMGMDAARREIADSKSILENKLGCRVDYLAYPTGGFSKAIKDLAAKAGYKAAFTTNRGHDRMNHDLFEIKRIRFQNTDGPLVMQIKLSGYYNFFRQSKKSY